MLFSILLIFLNSCTSNENKFKDTEKLNEMYSEKTEVKTDSVANSKSNSNQYPNDYIKAYETLPELTFPMSIYCGINAGERFNGSANTKIPGFVATAVTFYSSSSKLKMVLGYFQIEIRYPYLFSFDENGIKIDSSEIHNGNCANDPWIDETCWTQLKSLQNITMIDTTKYYTYNDKTGDRTLDSIVVVKDKVQINSFGKFKVVRLSSMKK